MTGNINSMLYDGVEGTIRKTGRRDAVLKELAFYKAREAEAKRQSIVGDAYSAGQNEGFIKGLEHYLTANNQHIQEGSPEDLAMQDNINRGINYQPEGPRPGDTSVIDAVRAGLSSAVDNFSDWYNAEPVYQPEQRSQLQIDQEADYIENESARAAQAEIDRLLSNKQ